MKKLFDPKEHIGEHLSSDDVIRQIVRKKLAELDNKEFFEQWLKCFEELLIEDGYITTSKRTIHPLRELFLSQNTIEKHRQSVNKLDIMVSTDQTPDSQWMGASIDDPLLATKLFYTIIKYEPIKNIKYIKDWYNWLRIRLSGQIDLKKLTHSNYICVKGIPITDLHMFGEYELGMQLITFDDPSRISSSRFSSIAVETARNDIHESFDYNKFRTHPLQEFTFRQHCIYDTTIENYYDK